MSDAKSNSKSRSRSTSTAKSESESESIVVERRIERKREGKTRLPSESIDHRTAPPFYQ